MSLKARLDIYRSDANGNVLPFDIELARTIASEYADRNLDGALLGEDPRILAYFNGEPMYLDRRGVLIVNLGNNDTGRLFAALCRMVRQMGVDVWLGDSNETLTERVCSWHSSFESSLS